MARPFRGFLSKLRSRRLKPKEKPEKVKRHKPIAKRAVVKVRDNPFKKSCRKPLKVPQAACIAIYRAEQLAIQSPAIDALQASLRNIGIAHRREEPIIVDYRKFFLVDVWCQLNRTGWEADGEQHKTEKPYDGSRDAIIHKLTGFRIIRHWNGWYLKPGLEERILLELAKGHGFDRL